MQWVAVAASRAERPVIEVAEGDLPGALAAAIEDPRRLEVRDAAGLDGLEPWLTGQPDLAVSLVASDPRPLQRRAARVRGRGHGRSGRRRRGPEAVARLRAHGRRERRASRRSRGEVDPDARFARHRVPYRCRSRSTRRSRPTSSTHRSAARPSPTSSRNGSISRCRRPRTSTRRRGPAWRRWPPVAVRAPLEECPRGRRPRSVVRRDRAAADRGPREDGGDGVALDLDALADARPRVQHRDRRDSSGRGLRLRSATSSRSDRPSSSARSSSGNSSCRSVGRRRPAIRRTRPSSRSCARCIRRSSRSSTGGRTRSCARPMSRRCPC